MKKRVAMLLAVALSFVIGGCTNMQTAVIVMDGPAVSQPAPASQSQEVLMVSAAASLSDALNELAADFTEEYAVEVLYNFGASGALQQQIEQGAPADLFFSAGKQQMDQLANSGLMAAQTIAELLENQVVLIVNQQQEAPADFAALTGEAFTQIGVGEPGSVPVGQYTAEIFESLGLTDALQDKLIYAKDVREVLAWVETGNVDAGIVYATDAKISEKVKCACTAPENSHKRVVYPVGLTVQGAEKPAAHQFLDYLFSSHAAEIFSRYGFSLAEAER
ncbi:MAG: molybdate ABC transporter substrate-binding protein [Anaerotruncus sp.]|nr:molybdate ABC transporter substrate-binding protein [Anaerotruncus sp.]